jgi:hypothetical protein
MVPRVGDLVQMIRELPDGETIPIGLLVDKDEEEVAGYKDAWCTIQWDDGDITGVWIDEIERVECE